MRLFLVLLFLALCVTTQGSDYPPPLDLGPTNTYGREMQRSIRLMTGRPLPKKRTVKIAIYGQSVSQEIWTIYLQDFIRARYTNVNLVITNLAVGYNAEHLRHIAPNDIAGFYPDLMLFHNYGALSDVESEMAAFRQRTTTDILLQTDHLHIPEDLNEPTDPLTPGGLPWWANRNYLELPDLAQRYGAELAHVRDHWKYYIRDYNISPTDLLRDHIHPSWQGSFLLAELLKPYFREDDSFDSASWSEAEKNYVVGRDLFWVNDTLTLNFVGNRVDLIVDQPGPDPVDVLIDGRRPSEFPELYQFSRTDWYPNTYWVTILEMNSHNPLLEQEWTAKVTESSVVNRVPLMRFEVYGSKTGFDGAGSIGERFVSNSGQVVIEPSYWLMLYWAVDYMPTLKPLPVGHEIRWKTVFFGKDQFIPEVPDPALETTVTVAQGLGNGPHTLTLRRHGTAPVSSIRIYNPLARTQPLRQSAPEITKLRRNGDNVALTLNVSGRYVIESSTDGQSWTAKTAAISVPEISIASPDRLSFFRVRALD